MRWNEDTQQLITCSKDKTVKIWELPDAWVDEANEKVAAVPKNVIPKKKSYSGIGEKCGDIWPKDMKYEKPVNLMQKEESK